MRSPAKEFLRCRVMHTVAFDYQICDCVSRITAGHMNNPVSAKLEFAAIAEACAHVLSVVAGRQLFAAGQNMSSTHSDPLIFVAYNISQKAHTMPTWAVWAITTAGVESFQASGPYENESAVRVIDLVIANKQYNFRKTSNHPHRQLITGRYRLPAAGRRLAGGALPGPGFGGRALSRGQPPSLAAARAGPARCCT